jgi:hypothetical protein
MTFSRMVNTFVWKNLSCELCKARFPESIIKKSNGFAQSLLPYSAPSHKDVVVLESIEPLNKGKKIHILDFSTNERIVVGRHESANIRINEITVSRFHAHFFKVG